MAKNLLFSAAFFIALFCSITMKAGWEIDGVVQGQLNIFNGVPHCPMSGTCFTKWKWVNPNFEPPITIPENLCSVHFPSQNLGYCNVVINTYLDENYIPNHQVIQFPFTTTFSSEGDVFSCPPPPSE